MVHEQNENSTYYDTSDHRQRNHTRCKYDTRSDRPEQKCYIQRLFDCCTETHDGKSTDHTERQDRVAGDCQNDDCRDHCQSYKRNSETCGIHNTPVSLLIDYIYEQTYQKRKDKGNDHIGNIDRADILEIT